MLYYPRCLQSGGDREVSLPKIFALVWSLKHDLHSGRRRSSAEELSEGSLDGASRSFLEVAALRFAVILSPPWKVGNITRLEEECRIGREIQK